MVSWKADGTRYMMYIQDKDNIFMVDRFYNFYRIFYCLPTRANPHEFHFETILDGEIVEDIDEHGKKIPRFLLFDLVTLDNVCMYKCAYLSIYQCAYVC